MKENRNNVSLDQKSLVLFFFFKTVFFEFLILVMLFISTPVWSSQEFIDCFYTL